MKVRFLPFLMLPILGMAQANSNGEIPLGGNTSSEKQTLEIKRNASYNLEEIKVRWKKAALENCNGAPCSAITAPGAPTGVVATVGNSVSVSFVAPTNNGGRAITGYTVTSNPGNITTPGTTSPIIVTGLTNGTSYTFTVTATNEVGNSVSSSTSTAVKSFTCGTGTISDVDNNPYETVLIGTQCWTKTNLKVINYNDGTLIPDLTTSTSNPWAPTSGARTEYVATGVAGYVGTFGYLYNWYAVTDSRKLCPDGWRVPTDSDWNKLVISLHSGTTVADTSSTSLTQSATAGTVMKSTVTNSSIGSGLGWNPGSPGTNTSLFSALPGGFRFSGGSFASIRNNAFFWSATESDPSSTAWYRSLVYDSGSVSRGFISKTFGASVRCLRD
jgi:uncharacterized protein (TIGR02145 family)